MQAELSGDDDCGDKGDMTDFHESSCSVHNMPAYPNGPCDCKYQEDLDKINWNAQPYVTSLQLLQMSPHKREWFESQPNVWRQSIDRDCLMNCAHPVNAEWVARDLLAEVYAVTGISEALDKAVEACRLSDQ